MVLIFSFASPHGLIKVQENQEEMDPEETHVSDRW